VSGHATSLTIKIALLTEGEIALVTERELALAGIDSKRQNNNTNARPTGNHTRCETIQTHGCCEAISTIHCQKLNPSMLVLLKMKGAPSLTSSF